MAAGYWTERHIDAERKLNLRAAIDKAGADPQKLRDVRGALAPVLRDTLVGLNYVHYAPPGAQVLFTNPAFVRSHDFYGTPGSPAHLARHRILGSGWPANAGGRLVGSLIALPYALAESRAELPDSFARAGADLGRSGAADDPERGDPALVERHARRNCIGWD